MKKPQPNATSPSRIFDFLRDNILAHSSASEVSRRSGLAAATVYRWLRPEYSPDQTAAFEKVLATYGWRIVLEPVPAPTENPMQLEVRHGPTPTPPPRS